MAMQSRQLSRKFAKPSPAIAVIDLGDFSCQPSAKFGHEPFGSRSLAGSRIFQRMIDQLQQCERVDDIYLVGSNVPSHLIGEPLVNVKTCWLPKASLIQRLAHAIDAADAHWCVYMPANRPFVCHQLIDQLLAETGDTDCDFIGFEAELGSQHVLSLGIAGEVLHCDAIRRLRRHCLDSPSMENESIVDNLNDAPGAFHLKFLPLPEPLDRDDCHFAIRSEQDWDEAEAMCRYLSGSAFSWTELVDARKVL